MCAQTVRSGQGSGVYPTTLYLFPHKFYKLVKRVDITRSDRAVNFGRSRLLNISAIGLCRLLAALADLGPLDGVAVAGLVAGPSVDAAVSKPRQAVESGIV